MARVAGRSGPSPVNLLFVCNENASRSPMAEATAKEMFPHWDIESAGISVHRPGRGLGTATSAAIGRRRVQMFLPKFHRRQITQDLADAADLIFVMTGDQAQFIRNNFGTDYDKVKLLDSAGDIPDPDATTGSHTRVMGIVRRAFKAWLPYLDEYNIEEPAK